ncbi:hypothetical protein RI054_08g43670 [Pseudoscourfieldia marina]
MKMKAHVTTYLWVTSTIVVATLTLLSCHIVYEQRALVVQVQAELASVAAQLDQLKSRENSRTAILAGDPEWEPSEQLQMRPGHRRLLSTTVGGNVMAHSSLGSGSNLDVTSDVGVTVTVDSTTVATFASSGMNVAGTLTVNSASVNVASMNTLVNAFANFPTCSTRKNRIDYSATSGLFTCECDIGFTGNSCEDLDSNYWTETAISECGSGSVGLGGGFVRGNSWGDLDGSNLIECAESCAANDSCVAFVYFFASGWCSGHSTCTTPVASTSDKVPHVFFKV